MNSKAILRNTAWYGLENVISYGTSFITSVAIARALGPTKMAYIIYVTYIVTITSSLGSVGIPATTRKYMSEFIGRGDQATARVIYFRTILLQTIVGTVSTLAAIAWVLHDSPAEYRTAALLLVFTTLPTMANAVSAQANVATENLSANLPASVSSTAVYFVVTLLAVFLHWGVTGIASAMFLMRFSDFAIRFFPAVARFRRWPRDGQVPEGLNDRMRHFALQSVAGMVLTLVVWDRSELILLKRLSPDIRQLAFYSVALGLADRLLIFPTIFGSAAGVTILAQYGRDPARLPALTAASVRYLALSSIPVHIIATALVGPALLTLYGDRYAGAVLVAICSPMLCLPKAFLGPIQSLFESTEQQKFFIYSTIVASFIDIGIAWWLIPSLGALGACLGSGMAQASAIGTMWFIGIREYKIKLPWRFMGRLTVMSAISAGLAYAVASRLPPLGGLLLGGTAAVLSFFVLAFLNRLLEAEDLVRLSSLVTMCPKPLAGVVQFVFTALSRRAATGSAAV